MCPFEVSVWVLIMVSFQDDESDTYILMELIRCAALSPQGGKSPGLMFPNTRHLALGIEGRTCVTGNAITQSIASNLVSFSNKTFSRFQKRDEPFSNDTSDGLARFS